MSPTDFWRSRRLANGLLLPLSWVFGLCAAGRRLAYRCGAARQRRMPVPVIVVGGITAGGGGKTSCTMALARQLSAAGFSPGIVSRGYRGKARRPTLVEPGTAPQECGDEAALMRRETGAPVCVGKSRPDAARTLLAAHPEVDVVVSDDGLQHLALRRDVEIAMVDPAFGLGNGWLLPAGPLREPASRLGQVDVVVGAPDSAAQLAVVRERLVPVGGGAAVDPKTLAGAVAGVAGIANPGRFFAALERAGIALSSRHAFPDHHPFRRSDLQSVRADHIVMTPKDAVKCLDFADERCLEWKVDHALDDATFEKVVKLIHGPENS